MATWKVDDLVILKKAPPGGGGGGGSGPVNVEYEPQDQDPSDDEGESKEGQDKDGKDKDGKDGKDPTTPPNDSKPNGNDGSGNDNTNTQKKNSGSGNVGDKNKSADQRPDKGGKMSDAEMAQKIKDAERRHKQMRDEMAKADRGAKPKGSDSAIDKPTGNYDDIRQKQAAQKVEWKYTPPKFSWRKYLDRIVAKASQNVETSYLKPARSMPTMAASIAQTGVGVVKPGEVKMESKIKLCILVDSSGSMTGVITLALNEIIHLLAKYKRLDNDFYFMRFSDSFELFKVNIKRSTFVKVSSVKEKAQGVAGNTKDLFTEHYGGGTNFSPALTAECKNILGAGYHMFIISDSDILGEHSHNAKNFQSVMQDSKAGAIFASRNDYINAIKLIGARENMTFFD
jgi:hypothetical protein